MKVLVLGAGVIGTTCAHYLAKAGHEVTVVDRQPGPALERKEWFQFIGSIVLLMIGTANVRFAAMRERQRKGMSR